MITEVADNSVNEGKQDNQLETYEMYFFWEMAQSSK